MKARPEVACTTMMADVVGSGGQWFILDIMRKGGSGPDRRYWVALMIDTDPDIFSAGLDRHRRTQSHWVDLGRHNTREDAWDHAEQLMATRH